MAELSGQEKQMWDYLGEVIADYERYLSDIPNLGLAAPYVLYYRDEIQEMLNDFRGNPRVDFRKAWEKVKALDEILRANQADIVKQIGHANFRQYQIINDPPRTHWWWFLNRVVSAPPPPPAWWQFWKKTSESEAEVAPSGEQGEDGLGVPDAPVEGHS